MPHAFMMTVAVTWHMSMGPAYNGGYHLPSDFVGSACYAMLTLICDVKVYHAKICIVPFRWHIKDRTAKEALRFLDNSTLEDDDYR
jgi:hypothetical protein